MIADGYADIGITQYHLCSYFTRTFPSESEVVPITGAEEFGGNIALARVVNPLRERTARAFEEYFMMKAREIYPNYDFSPMEKDAYGKALQR